jgi:hypothetical protein
MGFMPSGWAKPSGVPAHSRTVNMLTCYECGRQFPESQAHVIGNVDYPEDREFCSSSCSTQAYKKRESAR